MFFLPVCGVSVFLLRYQQTDWDKTQEGGNKKEMAGTGKTHKGHFLCTVLTLCIRPLTLCRKRQVCTCMYAQYTCVSGTKPCQTHTHKKRSKALPSSVPTNSS